MEEFLGKGTLTALFKERGSIIQMTRDEAKELFRNGKDSYGKPKAVMTKIDQIYDDFEKEKLISKDTLNDLRILLKDLVEIGPMILTHWCSAECSHHEDLCPRDYCLDDKISDLYEKLKKR